MFLGSYCIDRNMFSNLPPLLLDSRSKYMQ